MSFTSRKESKPVGGDLRRKGNGRDMRKIADERGIGSNVGQLSGMDHHRLTSGQQQSSKAHRRKGVSFASMNWPSAIQSSPMYPLPRAQRTAHISPCCLLCRCSGLNIQGRDLQSIAPKRTKHQYNLKRIPSCLYFLPLLRRRIKMAQNPTRAIPFNGTNPTLNLLPLL